MLHSTRSTFEPRISFASRKPLPRSVTVHCLGRRRGGQSYSLSCSTSRATTSAPRRSISNAQKPSHVPMSSARMPSIRSGRQYFATYGRRSNQPSVTSPFPRSIVWYQSCSCTRAAMSVVDIGALSLPGPECPGTVQGLRVGDGRRLLVADRVAELLAAPRGRAAGVVLGAVVGVPLEQDRGRARVGEALVREQRPLCPLDVDLEHVDAGEVREDVHDGGGHRRCVTGSI